MSKSKIYYGGIEIYINSYEKGDITPIFVKHNFPFSKKPYVEQTGMNIPTYRISGFFQNNGDYALLKPVYETILKSTSPQSLVLPDVGIVQAVCERATLSETADKNGIVQCSLEFTYAPLSASAFSLISVIEDPSSVLTSLQTEGISTITSGFSSALSGLSLSDISGPITDCLGTLQSAATNMISDAGQVTGIDGLLNGTSLGRYAQDAMNGNIVSDITGGSNQDIISNVASSASNFYSDVSSSIKSSVSSAMSDITSLI